MIILQHKRLSNPRLSQWIGWLVGWSLLGGISLFSGCSRPLGDKAVIEQVIAEMKTALEARQREAFMAHLADDFSGQEGHYDKAGAHQLLLAHFLRHARIQVMMTGTEVVLHPESQRATATIQALVTGSDSWIPQEGRTIMLTLGWRKTGGQWQIVNAHWQ